MDKVKLSQKVTRIAFTRAHTAFQAERARQPRDITSLQVAYVLVRDKASELSELSLKLRDLMIEAGESEETLCREMEHADEYAARYHQAKLELTRLIERQEAHESTVPAPSTSRQAHSAIATTQESIRTLKLPKIELRRFGGDIKDWLPFWGTFKKIHVNPALSGEDKFHYLIQSMIPDSRACEVVNSFPPTAENYEKVIQSFESRFGKKDLLIEFYVRELLKLVLSKSKNVSLTMIYDKLETHMRSLETLDVTTDMCAAMLFPLIESSLPEETLRTWQRTMITSAPQADASTTNRTAKDRLTNLMSFLEREVENEERILMAKTCFESSDTQASKDKDRKKTKCDQSPGTATAAGLLSVKESKAQPCLFCGEKHDSSSCEKARGMDMDERARIVKEKSGCFKCLKVGHSYKKCYSKEKCPWCSKGHCLMMCRNLSKNSGQKPADEKPRGSKFNEGNSCLANVSSTTIFLPVLRIRMRGPKGIISVRAIIDTGSYRSYILKKIARDLGYEAEGEQTMVHLLFGGTKTKPQKHKSCRIHIGNLEGTYKCDFIALQQDTICQDIPSVCTGPWTDALKEKNVHLSDTGEDRESISLLIGADVAGKLFTGKVIQLSQGTTAIETKLGWTILGRNSEDSNNTDTTLMVVSMLSHEASVSELWKLDTLGITDPIENISKEARQEEIKALF